MTGKLCDYLIGRSRGRDVCELAVELKSKVQHVSDIVDQLQAGLNRIATHGGEIAFRDVRAILVYSGSMPTHEVRLLVKKKLRYKGRVVELMVRKSGVDLSSV